jgi:hypothetical protein
MKGTLTLADAVDVAQHALKRGQQAEHNVENSLSLSRKVIHTKGFRLSGHFYITLPATLTSPAPGGAHPSRTADARGGTAPAHGAVL